jgi:multicomponent Na+:H+ antiporter subunit G
MIVNWLQMILVILLAGSGLFFMLIAAVGLIRMPDLFTRMHAATKASTLGISGIALAVIVYFADFTVATRALLIILFFFLTAPVGAHSLGRAAYMTGANLAEGTRRYDLTRARILCPTRGGLSSRELHEKAIQLAKESYGELVFLYVIPQDLVAAASPTESGRILNEMYSLGNSILSAAQASAKGLTTSGVIRVGVLQEEILKVAEEVKDTLVVLGYPEQDRADEQHLAEERLWGMVEFLQGKGIRVVLSR